MTHEYIISFVKKIKYSPKTVALSKCNSEVSVVALVQWFLNWWV